MKSVENSAPLPAAGIHLPDAPPRAGESEFEIMADGPEFMPLYVPESALDEFIAIYQQEFNEDVRRAVSAYHGV